MSGIEVAGLVLSAFPIVISALESYRDAFEPLSNWWKFQRIFENLIDDIGMEKALFENNMEKLLSPFVDSEIQMSTLIGDPLGPAWNRPDLNGKLESRLGNSVMFYKAIIARISRALEELQQLIGLDGSKDLSLWRKRDISRLNVKQEYKRFRIALKNNELQQHIELLSKQNSKLRILLSTSDELTPTRNQRNITPNTAVLRQLQSRALSIHAALSRSWKCSCRSHTTQLRLERRISDKSVIDSNWKVVLNTPSSSSSHAHPQEMEVEVEEEDSGSGQLNPSRQSVHPVMNHVDELKRDIEMEKTRMALTTSNVTASVTSVTTMLSGLAGLQVLDAVVASISPGICRNKPQKRVAFTHTPSPAAPTASAMVAPSLIEDMCTILRAKIDTTCLGFVHDQHERRHILYPSKGKMTRHHLTLHDALRANSPLNTHKVMSRKDRLRVAMIMASSVLQLHATPWLNERWNKNDVLLYLDDAGQRVIPDPFVYTEFQPGAGAGAVEASNNSNNKSRSDTKKILPSLGIALLELCFGKVIEDHPRRSEFFGPNNQPGAFTDLCTAKEWHEDVLDEIGDKMSDCIRRCLDCAFAPKPNLEDKEFQEAFFEGVIVPLQETLRIWEQI